MVCLTAVFDHVGIAVSDLAASERFYRTVLSVLDVEPSHADAELVEWEDWDIGATDPEHPVTRGLHVGFRAGDRAQVDAFWQGGVDFYSAPLLIRRQLTAFYLPQLLSTGTRLVLLH